MKNIKTRDIEKAYPKGEFIKKLRRLADSIESGKKFSIQVKGLKINVPGNAVINIEHEKNIEEDQLEFQIKWKN